MDLGRGVQSVTETRQEVSSKLLDWWHVHGRHTIPWKRRADGRPVADGEPLDPYPIWVAEVMLQQTQLQVVLPYWQRWMEAFPSRVALSAATEQEVLLLWQALVTTREPGVCIRERVLLSRPSPEMRGLVISTAGWRYQGSVAAPPAASSLRPMTCPFRSSMAMSNACCRG